MPNLCPLVFRSTHPSALIHPADEIIGVRFPRKVSYLILAHIDVTWDFWTSFWVAEMLGYPKTACMIQKTIIHDLIEILGILIHGIYVFQDHGFLSQDHHSWSNRLQFATAACGVPWMFFGEKGMMWWFCAMFQLMLSSKHWSPLLTLKHFQDISKLWRLFKIVPELLKHFWGSCGCVWTWTTPSKLQRERCSTPSKAIQVWAFPNIFVTTPLMFTF